MFINDKAKEPPKKRRKKLTAHATAYKTKGQKVAKVKELVESYIHLNMDKMAVVRKTKHNGDRGSKWIRHPLADTRFCYDVSSASFFIPLAELDGWMKTHNVKKEDYSAWRVRVRGFEVKRKQVNYAKATLGYCYQIPSFILDITFTEYGEIDEEVAVWV